MMIPMLRTRRTKHAVLFFDGGRKLIGKEQISSGGLNATIVDVRMILKRPWTSFPVNSYWSITNLRAISPADRTVILTQTLKEAARMVDLHLIDHIVIGGTATIALPMRDSCNSADFFVPLEKISPFMTTCFCRKGFLFQSGSGADARYQYPKRLHALSL